MDLTRWSPGLERARRNKNQTTPFIEGTATVVEPAPGTAFRSGSRVFHQKFGYGTVNLIEGDRLTIDFDKAGSKKVMAGFILPADQAG